MAETKKRVVESRSSRSNKRAQETPNSDVSDKVATQLTEPVPNHTPTTIGEMTGNLEMQIAPFDLMDTSDIKEDNLDIIDGTAEPVEIEEESEPSAPVREEYDEDLHIAEERFVINDDDITDDTEILEDTGENNVEPTTPINTDGRIRTSWASERKSAQLLKKFNPTNVMSAYTDDAHQRAIIEQHIFGIGSSSSQGNIPIGSRAAARTILPYSGIHITLSSFTLNEMLAIHRSSDSADFLDQITEELHAAWSHTVDSSLKVDFTFEDWLSSIYAPDVFGIYYGLYNANHIGENSYSSYCDNDKCRQPVTETRNNEDVTFISKNSEMDINPEIIDDIRRGINKDGIKPHIVAKSRILTGKLPVKGYIFEFGMPTLKEMLSYLRYMRDELRCDDVTMRGVFYPTSVTVRTHGGKNGNKGVYASIINHKYNMYLRTVYAPTFENAKDSNAVIGKLVKVEPTYLPNILNKLYDTIDVDDIRFLAKNDELKRLIAKEGIIYRVRNSKCNLCGTPQMQMELDMRNILFSEATTAVEQLTDM